MDCCQKIAETLDSSFKTIDITVISSIILMTIVLMCSIVMEKNQKCYGRTLKTLMGVILAVIFIGSAFYIT